MKTPATRFEVHINGKRFSDATVSLEDQLEVNIVTVAGQDAAVLAITAFIPEASKGGNYLRTENAVLRPGDSVTITLSAVEDAAPTSVGSAEPELQEESSEGGSMTCSFCGKTQLEVGKLVAGANAFICDECIVLCQEIITDED
jgi:hypothetical protein